MPLQPCRRHGKKRKEDESEVVCTKKDKNHLGKSNNINKASNSPDSIKIAGNDQTLSLEMSSILGGLDAQLQSSQVSSTVLDIPVSIYQNWNYQNDSHWRRHGWLDQKKGNWINPWGEFGSFRGLDQELRVVPDSTSLDESKPLSAMLKESSKHCQRNILNHVGESPKHVQNHLTVTSVSPTTSNVNTVNNTFVTVSRTCPITSQDIRIISPRSSGYSSTSSDFNSSPIPRTYQCYLESNKPSSLQRANQNNYFNSNNQESLATSKCEAQCKVPLMENNIIITNSEVLHNPISRFIDAPSTNIYFPRATNQNATPGTFRAGNDMYASVSKGKNINHELSSKMQSGYFLQSEDEQKILSNSDEYIDLNTPSTTFNSNPDFSFYNTRASTIGSLPNQSTDHDENVYNHLIQKNMSNNQKCSINNNCSSLLIEKSNPGPTNLWNYENIKSSITSIVPNISCVGDNSKLSLLNLQMDQPKYSFEMQSESYPFRVPKARPPSRTAAYSSNLINVDNSKLISQKQFSRHEEYNNVRSLPEDSANEVSHLSGQHYQKKSHWLQEELKGGNI